MNFQGRFVVPVASLAFLQLVTPLYGSHCINRHSLQQPTIKPLKHSAEDLAISSTIDEPPLSDVVSLG